MRQEERRELGERAKRRAREMFGMEAMCERLQDALTDAVEMGPVQSSVVDVVLAFGISVLAYLLFKFII